MTTINLHSDHNRLFGQNRFVYPVLSRRSGGISVGVNLNPDKVCNFDCIYCQVDRTSVSETRFVETDALVCELTSVVDLVASGKIFDVDNFRDTPPALRRFNDIAFSGDGEPTTYKNFDQLMEIAAQVRRDRQLADVKMVLITNATMFHRPHVQRGLAILDENNGQIWAKLDAGTEDYYHRVERTSIPLQRVLDNILLAAKVRPIVIQSLFMRIEGEPPSENEQIAFCDRLNDVVAAGGQIDHVQVYTVARPPAESFVTSLRTDEVEAIARLVRDHTGIAAVAY